MTPRRVETLKHQTDQCDVIITAEGPVMIDQSDHPSAVYLHSCAADVIVVRSGSARGRDTQNTSVETWGASSAGVSGSGLSYDPEGVLVSTGGPTADRLPQHQWDPVCVDL